MTPEKRIYDSAKSVFLVYGFHGTTLQRIADTAGVNKAAIHYYFRSKENLYQKVVKEIFKEMVNLFYIDYDILWFIMTEFRNNREMLLRELNNTEGNNVLEIYSYLEYAFKSRSFFELKDWMEKK